MEKKLTELFLVLCGIALSMFAAVKLLSGSWSGLLWVMLCFLPFLLALFLGLKNWWPLMAVVLPLIPLPAVGAVLLDKFTPTMTLNLVMLMFFIGHICIWHRGVSLKTKYARPMLVVAVMITARLAIDPPGSGRVGGTGGLSMALNYLMAGWSFFSVWWATQTSTVSERKLAKWFLGLSAVLFAWKLISTLSVEYLYHFSAWVFFPFLLGWVGYKNGLLKNRWGLFYLLSCVAMACGVLNPHRKSLAMAVLMCVALAWIFRVERKQILVLGTAGLLGLGILLTAGHVPEIMKRSLSTILPSLTIESSDAGYMGFEDDFRKLNFDYAVKDILHRPLIGRGFSFSTADVVAMLNRETRSGMAGASELANAVGIQHYGFISLMTVIGLIVPWFYAAAGFGIFFSFLRLARNLPGGYSKVLAAGLTGYFINMLFQWLFNGAGERMLDMSILLGIMMGLFHRWTDKGQKEQNSEISDQTAVNPLELQAAANGRVLNRWARRGASAGR